MGESPRLHGRNRLQLLTGWALSLAAPARPVAAACGANPIPIIIPCHRVIGSNGTLTGFGGGLESITTAKQLKLRKTAELYLQQNTRHKNARFDVVSMSKNNQTSDNKQEYIFEWIIDAF